MRTQTFLYNKVFSGDGEKVLDDIVNNLCDFNGFATCGTDLQLTYALAVRRDVAKAILEIKDRDLDKLAKEEFENDEEV